MKKSFLILTFSYLISTFIANAQDYKWSISAYYPIAVNEEHFREAYSGTLGLELNYLFIKKESISLDAVLSVAHLSGNVRIPGTISPYTDVNSIFFQSGVQARIESIPKFQPFFGLGLTSKISSYDLLAGRSETDFETSFLDLGINFDLGFHWHWGNQLYFLLKYDYTQMLGVEKTADYERSLESIGMVQGGLGFKF